MEWNFSFGRVRSPKCFIGLGDLLLEFNSFPDSADNDISREKVLGTKLSQR
jgi:hypothetical protein